MAGAGNEINPPVPRATATASTAGADPSSKEEKNAHGVRPYPAQRRRYRDRRYHIFSYGRDLYQWNENHREAGGDDALVTDTENFVTYIEAVGSSPSARYTATEDDGGSGWTQVADDDGTGKDSVGTGNAKNESGTENVPNGVWWLMRR